MQWPSTRSDCLRAIGHVLDEAGASHVQIEEDDTSLLVRYATGRGDVELRYPSLYLDELLTEARSRRARGVSGLNAGYEQNLRVIGSEMDRNRGRSIRVREHEESFGANFISRDGLRVNNTYLPAAILSLIEVGARRRRESAEASASSLG